MSDLNILNAGINDVSKNISNLNRDVNDAIEQATNNWIDGLTKANQKIENTVENIDLNIEATFGKSGWFKDTFEALVGTDEGLGQLFHPSKDQSEAVNFRNGILDRSDVQSVDRSSQGIFKLFNTKSDKVQNIKLDDLKKIPLGLGMAFALIHEDLLGLKQPLTEEKKGGKKGNSKNFFSNILDGSSGLALVAASILTLGAALLAFNNIEWGKTAVGIVSFTAFTIGMVYIAKVLGRELDTFTKFSAASLILSKSLAVFAVALLISSLIMNKEPLQLTAFGLKLQLPAIDLSKAILGVGLFTGFIILNLLAAKLLGGNLKILESFTQGSISLIKSLILFTGALYLVGNIVGGKDTRIPFIGIQIPGFKLKDSLVGLGLFLGFMTFSVVLAKLAGQSINHLRGLAISSMLLSLGLIVFTAALYIASSIFTYGSVETTIAGLHINLPAFDMSKAILGMGAFIVFFTLSALLAKFGGNALKYMIPFTISSLLLSGALLVFSIAIYITGSIFSGEPISIHNKYFDFDLPAVSITAALAGAGSFIVFMVLSLVLGALGTAAILPAIGLAAAAVLMSVAMAMFAVAVSATIMAMRGGKMTILGKEFDFGPETTKAGFDRIGYAIEGLATMAGFLIAFGGMGALLLPLEATGALASAVFLAIAEATKSMSLGISLMGAFGQKRHLILKFDGKEYEVYPTDKKDWLAGIGAMKSFFSDFKGMIDFQKKSAVELKSTSESISAMMDVINKMSDSLNKVKKFKKGIKIDPKLFEPLVLVIDQLVYVCRNLNKSSAEVIAIVSTALTPIVEAMDRILDTVEKAANLRSKDGTSVENLVDKAKKNLNVIASQMFGTLGPIHKVIASLKNIDIKSEETFAILPQVVESMSGLTNFVIQLASIKAELGEDIDMKKITKTLKAIGNVLENEIGGLIKKLSTLKDKGIHSVSAMVAEGGPLRSVISAISEMSSLMAAVDGGGLEKLKNFTLTDSFIKNSRTFLETIKNMSYDSGSFSALETSTSNVADEMIRLGNVTLEKPLGELDRLGGQAGMLRNVAAALREITKETDKLGITSNANPVIGAMKGFGNFVNNTKKVLFKSATEGDASSIEELKADLSMEMNNDFDDSVSRIVEILKKWDDNGIAIRGLSEEEKEELVEGAYSL